MKVSIIIPSLNDDKNLLKTIQSIKTNTLYQDYEIIVVRSVEKNIFNLFGKRTIDIKKFYPEIKLIHYKKEGPGRARNLGATEAIGDLLVFIDSHCQVDKGWLERFVSFFKRHKRVGIVGPSIYNIKRSKKFRTDFRYGWTLDPDNFEFIPLKNKPKNICEIPFLQGCCHVVRRSVFYKIGMFDGGMKNWGYEDMEICLRAWLLGYPQILLPEIEVGHITRSSFPYSVTWHDADRNLLRLIFTHFSSKRIKKALDILQRKRNITKPLIDVVKSDVWKFRDQMMKKRKYSDYWFFEKFDINF